MDDLAGTQRPPDDLFHHHAMCVPSLGLRVCLAKAPRLLLRAGDSATFAAFSDLAAPK
jgi:hypothetical protein